MDLEPAVLGLFEGEGEGGKLLPRAQPDVTALAHVDVRLEHIRMARARLAVHALRHHHQVRVLELLVVVQLHLEILHHAQRGRAFLQDVEQLLAADAGKAVTAGADHAALEVHVDVVPVVEVIDDARMRGRIRHGEVAHGLVGEHHAPTEGVVGLIALEHLDAGGWQGPF